MSQDSADAPDAPELTARSIEIEHTEEGSSVAIEDPTWPELAALALIAATVLGAIWAWRAPRSKGG